LPGTVLGMTVAHCPCASWPASTTKQADALHAEGRGYRYVSVQLGLSQHAVRIHWAHLPTVAKHNRGPAEANEARGAKESDHLGSLEMNGDSGVLRTGTLHQPINTEDDWADLIRGYGRNPELFEVIEPVKCKVWDAPSKDADGNPQTIRCYAYQANLQRKASPEETAAFDEAIERIRKWKPSNRRTLGTGLGPESTLVVNWSDLQLGKSEGGGIAATTERFLDGVAETEKRMKDLRKLGRNVEGIAINNMGDPYEGCMGNYASQLFTVEGNLRKQMKLTVELFLQGMKALLPLAEQAQVSSVLCNHGELGRGSGNKNQTSDSDNGSALIMEMLELILKENGAFDHVQWTIPHDEMVTPVTFSGVRTALSHGHKAPGNIEKYVDDQSRVLTYVREFQPELWILAHRHHFHAADLGPYTYLQCPSNDGGSKWLTDMKGRWSTAGTLTFLVGKHNVRNYSDLAIL
jgi:hypothetical protein